MSIGYQERRIAIQFVRDKGKILCLCGPMENASGIPARMLDGEAYIEAGELMLKVVANLPRESGSAKGAVSAYQHPGLFYEMKIAAPEDAVLRGFLGFKTSEKDAHLEVVAEDFWNHDSLKEMAACIELYLKKKEIPAVISCVRRWMELVVWFHHLSETVQRPELLFWRTTGVLR